MNVEEGTLYEIHRLGVRSINGREGRLKLIRRSHINELQLDRQRARGRLEILANYLADLVRRVNIRFPHNRDPLDLRNRFLEQLQPFCKQCATHARDSGNISPRMRELRDEARREWVEQSGDDGDGGCGARGRLSRNQVRHENDVDLQLDEFLGEARQTIEMAQRGPELEPDVLP